jgi:signal transduction histidine kinase/DNA-binding response OmpR family regulator
MTPSLITPSDHWAEEMEGTFKQLQKNTIWLTIPGLFVASIFLFGLILLPSTNTWSMVAGAELLVLVPILRYVSQKSFLTASYLLIVGSLAVVLEAVFWGGYIPAICLLIIPVGLTILTLGTLTGILMAAGSSLLILSIPTIMNSSNSVVGYSAIIAVWSTVGMIWLTLNPLLTAVQWSWNSYERSLNLLQQSRDYQQKLGQTLEDLTNANINLTRLNQLANGLRQIAEDERQAKEQFVANVSHELRTPLNMIIGFCEMILKVPETYGRAIPINLLADLQVVLRNSQHLSSLIDDVLDLSQIEAGQMALMKERVDLADLVQSVTIAVRPLYESKRLNLETEVPDDLPRVYCDRTRIREVLLNLLSNAGRFTERGGVNMRVWQEENFVLVSVTDTGQGIPEDAKKRLFQPFQQVDGTIRRRYGGTGLGLSISKSFVELHDGKMWVESKEGRGATFYFRLPIDPASSLQSSFSRWVNPYTTFQDRGRVPELPTMDVRPRVLVVEEDKTLQRLLNRYLDHVEVVAVPTLEAAIEDLAHTPARTLLINHIQVVDTLKSLLETPTLPFNTPAIVCSIPGSSLDTSSLNVVNYLTKPISRDALLEALEKLEKPVKTILMVDDEPDAQQLFRRMLSSAHQGYRVLRAGDGQQALEILSRQKVDVILLDLIMPEMDGFQFLKIKGQESELQEIPVIVISARDPLGHPIVSNVLAVTRGGGLSAHQLLECVQAISSILSPTRPSGGPKPPAVSPC